MNWIVTTNKEKECLAPERKFKVMYEALKENLSLIIFEKDKDLECIKENDIVIVETKDYHIIEILNHKGIRNTGESRETISYDIDKIALKKKLKGKGILTPKRYILEELKENKEYFVKPFILEDSLGIDSNSLCYTINQVTKKVKEIHEKYGVTSIIEDYISGKDITVGIIRESNSYLVQAIEINGNCNVPFLTEKAKTNDKETYTVCEDKNILDKALDTFLSIGAKNYARIDFRVSEKGTPYVLEVNLYPGLKDTGYMYKCFELNLGMQYPEMLKKIINLSK